MAAAIKLRNLSITLSPRILFRSPARFSIFGFASLIAVGTALLMLPAAATSRKLGFVDALFTAVSASCVTGLVVVDTGTALSRFGQLVILGLIQAGGLGIMTMSTLFLLIGGRRPSLVGRMVIQDAFTGGGERRVPDIIRDVFLFTLVIEGIGASAAVFAVSPRKAGRSRRFISPFSMQSAPFAMPAFPFFQTALSPIGKI